jgi:hypothetical protein
MSGVQNLGGTKLGGGPYNGWSPQQTQLNFKDSQSIMIRKVLVKSWNTPYATGRFNNYGRVTTPFRAVNNSGDFLGRVQYSDGGPNPVTIDRYKTKNNIGSMFKNTDATKVPASSCNLRFVADSSDYVTFKKQTAINRNYNDLKFGGNQNNAQYVNKMAVRHHK